MINITNATPSGLAPIQRVIRDAFPPEEGTVICTLADDLFKDAHECAITSLIATVDGQCVGYIAFSPVKLPDSSGMSGYILSPLAISTHVQKQGIGTQLIREGIARLVKTGTDFVLVYGDPAYYGRFGFDDETAKCFMAPYPLDFPFGWQGIILSDVTPPTSPCKIQCTPALCKPNLW